MNDKIIISTTINKELLEKIKEKGLKLNKCLETGAKVLLGEYEGFNTKAELQNIKIDIQKTQKNIILLKSQLMALNKVLLDISNRDALKEFFEEVYKKSN